MYVSADGNGVVLTAFSKSNNCWILVDNTSGVSNRSRPEPDDLRGRQRLPARFRWVRARGTARLLAPRRPSATPLKPAGWRLSDHRLLELTLELR